MAVDGTELLPGGRVLPPSGLGALALPLVVGLELQPCAALSGEADVVTRSLATPGPRGAYQFVVGQGGLATFSGGIGWRRGFGEAPTAFLGFNGGSPFEIAATPAAAASQLLEAGVDFDQADGLDITAAYAGDLAASGRSHAVKAGPGGQF